MVSLAGVVDLGAADRLHLGDGAARAFVGSDAGSAAWTTADPMTTLPRVPVRLLWGGEDDVVPAAVGDAYLARARAGGADVTSEVIDGRRPLRAHRPDLPRLRRTSSPPCRSLTP